MKATLLRWLILGVLIVPTVARAADCGSASGNPNCVCGDKVKGTYSVSGNFPCNCANDACLRTYASATITGSGSLVAGTANPNQNAVAIENVTSVSVSGITVTGAFFDGIVVQDSGATLTNVTISHPTHYGVHVFTTGSPTSIVMNGGTVSYAGNEGIHIEESTGDLSGVEVDHSADEAVYLFGSTGTLTDVTVNGFGERPSVASAVYLKDKPSAAANMTAIRLTVTGGDASQGKCVDVTSFGLANSASIDNSTISGSSGFNCKKWVKATAPSSASLHTSNAICCCKLVTAGSTVTPTPACVTTCGGCC